MVKLTYATWELGALTSIPNTTVHMVNVHFLQRSWPDSLPLPLSELSHERLLDRRYGCLDRAIIGIFISRILSLSDSLLLYTLTESIRLDLDCPSNCINLEQR